MNINKIALALFLSFSTFCAFSQIPDQLKGTWTREDRILFLDKEDDISIILKDYYGWYYDRAVEPKSYSELMKRDRNAASQKTGHSYSVSFNSLDETLPVWEMEIIIDSKTKSIIPIAILDNKIYLNFLKKIPYDENQEMDTEEELNENPFYGYWQGLNCNDSIRIHPRNNLENIISWYITENGIYRLRFWQSKMEYETSKAVFSDGNKLYTINKHIFSAGTNYSCVSGRSSNIRNVEKYPGFPFEYKIDDSGNLMVLGKPYLVKVEEKDTPEKILEIVKEANSRRKSGPKDLFPVTLPTWPGSKDSNPPSGTTD